MNTQTERPKAIEAYIKNNPEAKIADVPIVIGGERKILPVYKLPFDLLCYNIDNGRFAVEKILLEKDLGRSLNYDDPDDIKRIRKMLIGEDPDLTAEAKALMKDLRLVGQLEPGVITHDGSVINGNRRMAVIELLDKKDPIGKWKYLEVGRLPPNIGSQDLWRIEAGLQLSKEKREKYGPMNELLKIKEGQAAELSNDEIAAAMFEWTSKEVEDALERLKLIDTFLEYIGEKDKGGYGFIETYHLNEHFEDLQDYVYKPARKAGLPRKEWSKRLNHAFDLIFAAAMLMKTGRKGDRITHWDFRDIREVYEDVQATDLFLRRLSKAKTPKAQNPQETRDDFNDARELVAEKKDKKEPRRLMDKAIRTLKGIDRKSEHFQDDAVKEAFKELDKVVATLKKDLGL